MGEERGPGAMRRAIECRPFGAFQTLSQNGLLTRSACENELPAICVAATAGSLTATSNYREALEERLSPGSQNRKDQLSGLARFFDDLQRVG